MLTLPPSDKMSIGNAELTSLEYIFWNNKLMRVEMMYEGRENYDLLRTVLRGISGKLFKVEEYGSCSWLGATTFIELKYDRVLDRGYLSFNSVGLLKKMG